MNLVNDSWIPIVYRNGDSGKVSLLEASTRGEDIFDLAVRPHERIALMRLLICVAQAALDGPASRTEWLRCRNLLPQAADHYLSRWRHTFELFGDGPRFLQVPGLQRWPGREVDTLVSKLDIAMAGDNSPTLFDNGAGSDRTFASLELALMLLTNQCFSPGSTIGTAVWNGVPTSPVQRRGQPRSSTAPCLFRNLLHTFLRGSSLSETIYLNLINREQVEHIFGPDRWGRPVWECMPRSPVDDVARANATLTYLGRLVPVCRAVRLNDDLSTMIYADGLSYTELVEPASTEITGPNSTRVNSPLSASLDRAVWRELHSILVLPQNQRGRNRGPLALQNLTGDRGFLIWTGAAVADLQKAKLLDIIESVFSVPAEMLSSRGASIYVEGIDSAEQTLPGLRTAIDSYWHEYNRVPGKKAPKGDTRNERLKSQKVASRYYWAMLEQGVPDLLAVVAEPASLGLDGWRHTPWGKLVERSAAEAFDLACPRGSVRQIRAYSAALPRLKEGITNPTKNDRSGSRNAAGPEIHPCCPERTEFEVPNLVGDSPFPIGLGEITPVTMRKG